MKALTRGERMLLLALTALTALAGVTRYADVSKVLAFAVSGLALAGLAWIVSFGTEQVGARLGPGGHGDDAVDARQPARVLRGGVRAVEGRDGGGADLADRLDPRAMRCSCSDS